MSGSTGRLLIKEFEKFVEVHVPGVPKPLMDQVVHQVLNEFFTETQVYTCLLCAENVRTDIVEYDFARPNRMVRVDVFKHVWFDNREIPALQTLVPSTISEIFPVQGYARTAELEIRLLFEPTEDLIAGLNAEAVLVPNRVSETIPCLIFETNYIGIAHGVIAELKAMPKKQWTDREGAVRNQFLYVKGKQEARVDQNKFGTDTRVVVRAPRLFAGGNRSRRRPI